MPVPRRRVAATALVIAAAMFVGMSGYTVERGDTLSDIATKHGTTVRELVEANGIRNANRIYVGQHLTIPGTSQASSGEPVTYVVQSGDTLASIASKLKTTVSSLVASNSIANANRIYVGQTLAIPSGSSGGAGDASYYTVVAGDTLASIAARLNTTVAAIAAANGITNTNVVYVGTRLVIGEVVSPEAAPGSVGTGSRYTVVAGDTLSSIGARYGLSAAQLASANNMGDPNRIRIGQVLEVPGSVGFMCPVPGGSFFNDWGFPRAGSRFHEGTDLFAARGTPVVAPVDGYVHQIVGTIGGIQFRLDGDDGHRYVGTHMDAFGAAGQVRAGDVIGYVGDSGNALGSRPHLHFEIILNRSQNTNPYPYLAAACR